MQSLREFMKLVAVCLLAVGFYLATSASRQVSASSPVAPVISAEQEAKEKEKRAQERLRTIASWRAAAPDATPEEKEEYRKKYETPAIPSPEEPSPEVKPDRTPQPEEYFQGTDVVAWYQNMPVCPVSRLEFVAVGAGSCTANHGVYRFEPRTCYECAGKTKLPCTLKRFRRISAVYVDTGFGTFDPAHKYTTEEANGQGPCGGDGHLMGVVANRRWGEVTCKTCSGTGSVPCPACGGDGIFGNGNDAELNLQFAKNFGFYKSWVRGWPVD